MKEYKDGKYDIKENFKGDKFWHLNGVLHREDGPACEYSNGVKYWFLNGKRHREDGPAIEWNNGNKLWYLNDVKYTEFEYHKKIEEIIKSNEVTFEEFMEEIR